MTSRSEHPGHYSVDFDFGNGISMGTTYETHEQVKGAIED
jgi:hypothetical protein